MLFEVFFRDDGCHFPAGRRWVAFDVVQLVRRVQLELDPREPACPLEVMRRGCQAGWTSGANSNVRRAFPSFTDTLRELLRSLVVQPEFACRALAP